jgi:lactoylglutathione lyase
MGKVIGLGGVFIHLEGDKEELFKWYHKNLGLDFSKYGTGFIEGEQLMFIGFKRKPYSKDPQLNFRVDDITSIVDQLKHQNIQFKSDLEDLDYGKFIIFEDPFGNQIELWEANADAYRAMVKKEIQNDK